MTTIIYGDIRGEIITLESGLQLYLTSKGKRIFQLKFIKKSPKRFKDKKKNER